MDRKRPLKFTYKLILQISVEGVLQVLINLTHPGRLWCLGVLESTVLDDTLVHVVFLQSLHLCPSQCLAYASRSFPHSVVVSSLTHLCTHGIHKCTIQPLKRILPFVEAVNVEYVDVHVGCNYTLLFF